MQVIEWGKRLLAIVIMVCFFLPLSECSSSLPESDGKGGTQAATPKVFVAANEVRFAHWGDAVVLAVFTWPVLLIALRARIKARAWRMALTAAEALLAVLSGVYLMQVIELWGHYRYGGVIVVTACALYALAALAEGIGWWQRTPARMAPPG